MVSDFSLVWRSLITLGCVIPFLFGCSDNPMDTPYFEFASDSIVIDEKSEIITVPSYVNYGFVEISSDPVYSYRRAVAVGVTAEQLLQFSFGTKKGRMILPPSLHDKRYIAEVIVPDGSRYQLMDNLRSKVLETLSLKAEYDYRNTIVWELSTSDNVRFPVSNKSETTWSQKDGHIAGTGMSLSLLSVVLESILENTPVLLTSDDTTEYDIILKWRPGNTEDLKKKLSAMGIEVIETSREINMLVFDLVDEIDHNPNEEPRQYARNMQFPK